MQPHGRGTEMPTGKKNVRQRKFARARRSRAVKKRFGKEAIGSGYKVVVLNGIKRKICTCGNPKCTSQGKHPNSHAMPKGVKDAVDSYDELKELVAPLSHFNLAICTGGMTVIDADSPEAVKKIESLASFRATTKVLTGKGAHYYYGGETRSRTRLGPDIDIKSGSNSYVVMPSSDHISGTIYKYDIPLSKIRALPKTLLSEIAGESDTPKKRGSVTVNFNTKVQEGGRNDHLARVAGRFRRMGCTPDQINAVLLVENQSICYPPLTDDEVSQIADSIGKYRTSADEHFKTAADVEPKKVRYFWPPYLAEETIAFLEGDPGTGKTFLALYLASQFSSGKPLPGTKRRRKGNVLILSGEDSVEHTLVPRLIALDADLNRIRVMDKLVPLNKFGLEILRSELEAHPEKFVVIDPVVAFMESGINMHHANEVREFMVGIMSLANEYGCSILMVRHLTKSTQGKSAYRGLGSIDFQAAARSVLRFGVSPEDPDEKIMVHLKTNFGLIGKSLTFELVGGRGKIPKLVATGETDATAEYLDASDRGPGNPGDERERAKDFIRTKLASGPMTTAIFNRDADAAAISAKTLERARRDLNVKSYRKGSQHYVKLPGTAAPV